MQANAAGYLGTYTGHRAEAPPRRAKSTTRDSLRGNLDLDDTPCATLPQLAILAARTSSRAVRSRPGVPDQPCADLWAGG